MMNDRIGLQVRASAGPGVLHQLTGAIAQQRGDISSVEISSQGTTEDLVYFEIDLPGSVDQLVASLRQLAVVHEVEVVDTLKTIYGKRIIIMGGGAQVGQVAIGAISEADRHNIRGERISVDTIPLVGEKELAAAVRATARLPRVKLLVLAGSIMGGDVTRAVVELRRHGVPVIALNMVGSVTGVADLVVSDPVQAGTMAVMAIADTAQFDLARQRGRRY